MLFYNILHVEMFFIIMILLCSREFKVQHYALSVVQSQESTASHRLFLEKPAWSHVYTQVSMRNIYKHKTYIFVRFYWC